MIKKRYSKLTGEGVDILRNSFRVLQISQKGCFAKNHLPDPGKIYPFGVLCIRTCGPGSDGIRRHLAESTFFKVCSISDKGQRVHMGGLCL